jgi:hypothetical protein
MIVFTKARILKYKGMGDKVFNNSALLIKVKIKTSFYI